MRTTNMRQASVCANPKLRLKPHLTKGRTNNQIVFCGPFRVRRHDVVNFDLIKWDVIGTLDFNYLVPIIRKCCEFSFSNYDLTSEEIADFVTDALTGAWYGMLEYPRIAEEDEFIEHYECALGHIWEELHDLTDRVDKDIRLSVGVIDNLSYFIDIDRQTFIYGGNYV